MVPIHLLILPILLSAVFVFVASSLIHMVLGYHSSDLHKLPDENAFAEALRKLNIPSGNYALPCPSGPKEMGTPEFKEKLKKGPRALLTVWTGGSTSMAPNLVQWFVYSLVIGVFAAYVAGRALGPGAPFLAVFRFAGVTAFASYAIGGWSESIWYKRPLSLSLKNTLDGLIYALITAGTFGWLWPQ